MAKTLLKFKYTKFEEIWWTYVGLINIFLGHPVALKVFFSK
jgi:hypothetical protein